MSPCFSQSESRNVVPNRSSVFAMSDWWIVSSPVSLMQNVTIFPSIYVLLQRREACYNQYIYKTHDWLCSGIWWLLTNYEVMLMYWSFSDSLVSSFQTYPLGLEILASKFCPSKLSLAVFSGEEKKPRLWINMCGWAPSTSSSFYAFISEWLLDCSVGSLISFMLINHPHSAVAPAPTPAFNPTNKPIPGLWGHGLYIMPLGSSK